MSSSALEAVPEPSAPHPAAAPRLEAPVAAAERIGSVDVLRGFALLGILVMNIVGYALPDAAYSNPLLGGGFTGADRLAWVVSYLFFEMKMVTIFSMLFGAGLVIMAGRADQDGRSLRRVYLRRTFWLLLLGMVHAYLVWWGDILVTYAECGFLLYLFWRRSARTLLVTGIIASVIGLLPMIGFSFGIEKMKKVVAEAEAARAARKPLTKEQAEMVRAWENTRKEMAPGRAELDEEIATYRAGWKDIAEARAPKVLKMQTLFFIIALLWRIGGTMLIGMACMKLGVFSAARTEAFYLRLMAVGYGLGLPLCAWGAWALITHGFDLVFALRWGGLGNYFGSFAVAFGHVGLVMTAWKRGWLRALVGRLGAVGQMAFTNYLTHSLVCTTLFYGYGFGLFGHVGRAWLLAVVLAIWAFQLAASPWWLQRFRFGPAEWVWRSLTYGRRQPLAL